MGLLLAEWAAARAAIKAAEAAEHPDLTDKFGRVWVWKSGDLYVHDCLAWPADAILSDRIALPSPSLKDNQNYRLCGVCRREWPV